MEDNTPKENLSEFEKTCLLYADWCGADSWEIVLATD